MLKQNVRHFLPVVPNPWAPYGAQGLDSSILIRHNDDQQQPVERFDNPFQTDILVVDWTHDGDVLLAGSITGEVLAWRFATGERLLANRHTHSYAPICGLSWSPGGYYLVAITIVNTIQIWHVATRVCRLVLPCQESITTITWNLDGSDQALQDQCGVHAHPNYCHLLA